MTAIDWNETARGIAGFMQQFRLLLERGAVSLQYDSEWAPGDEDRPVVVGVFGNDNDLGNTGQREVEFVRKRVDDADLEELGYGESADQATWALLIGSQNHCRTASGKIFQEQMMKLFLDDLVWRAWENVQRPNYQP